MRMRGWLGAVALTLILALAYVDRASGPYIDVTFGYIILIVVATINLGQRGAVLSVILAESAAVIAKYPWVGGQLHPTGFAANTVLRFAAFATVAVLVNQVVTERAKVERLSVTDKLTGLFNRRRFDEALAEEALRADRYRHPLGLVIYDVDHFKRYNDRHGHVRGDAVLRQSAKIALRVMRATDLAFRYGGEEFCLLLPETGLHAAAELAERLRTAIEKESFIGEHTQPGARVTASFGVAVLTPGEDARHLVARADAALYRAKQDGRNRVVVSDASAVHRDASRAGGS